MPARNVALGFLDADVLAARRYQPTKLLSASHLLIWSAAWPLSLIIIRMGDSLLDAGLGQINQIHFSASRAHRCRPDWFFGGRS
jgi:hypothetical protein